MVDRDPHGRSAAYTVGGLGVGHGEAGRGMPAERAVVAESAADALDQQGMRRNSQPEAYRPRSNGAVDMDILCWDLLATRLVGH